MRPASFLLTTAAMALLGRPAFAHVGEIKLSDLINESQVIAIVKVEAVSKIAGVAVARGQVVTGFVGAATGDRVAFVAEPTWTCDASNAYQHEVVLVFLQAMPDELHWMFKGKPARLKAAIARAWKGTPAYVIAHAGRGRMPLETVQGVTLVDPESGGVAWPVSLARDAHRRIALDDLVPLLTP
jgi:hypothetical protein